MKKANQPFERMKRSVIILLIPITWIALLAPVNAQQTTSRPNIVLILADDLGYGSTNPYGADPALVRTPNINRIAAKGMLFTDASTPASICTPTRYGMLTGRYPWRSSLKFGVTGPVAPLLPDPDRVTIADWLKERGYQTAAIGKWHLGYGQEPLDYTTSVSPGPLDLGFDYHFGVPQNHDDKLGVYIENDHIYGLRSRKLNPYSKSFYGSQYMGFDAPQRVNIRVMEELTDKAVQWIKQQDTVTPFFLYFASVAVHHPSTPSDHMRGLSDCGPYGDFIQDLDMSVGRIMETLEYMNLLENTLVIFTSDNGGDIPLNRPDSPELQAIGYGLKINGDLRGDKHTIYEGGTRVPFLVSWPGYIEAGTRSDGMINLLDIFATICELTDGRLPETAEIAPDSYSFLPLLLQKGELRPRPSMVTADANGMQAIRMGPWKFVDDIPPSNLPENRRKQIREFSAALFDLDDDPAEEHDLYDERSDMVDQLKEELDRIRNSATTR